MMLVLLLGGTTQVLAQSMAQEDLILQAQTLASDFQKNLKGALTQAMANGGPVRAIDVCKVDAPAIAEELSSEGWVVARTALKVRNPANAPSDWERSEMEQMQRQLGAGKTPAEIVVARVRDTDQGKVFSYLQPIMTGKLCLTCHGEELAPPVAEALATHYPDDQAIGFKEGELRGAFSFSKALAGK
jgi:hypothetical protein